MTDDDLRRLFEEFAARQDAKQSEAHAETRRHVDAVAAETRQHSESVAAETRRHFDVVTEDTARKLELLSEGLDALGERVDARIDRLEEKVDRGFAETHAMIKFSHSELDRRIRTLEEGMADLQARVNRLESGPH